MVWHNPLELIRLICCSENGAGELTHEGFSAKFRMLSLKRLGPLSSAPSRANEEAGTRTAHELGDWQRRCRYTSSHAHAVSVLGFSGAASLSYLQRFVRTTLLLFSSLNSNVSAQPSHLSSPAYSGAVPAVAQHSLGARHWLRSAPSHSRLPDFLQARISPKVFWRHV